MVVGGLLLLSLLSLWGLISGAFQTNPSHPAVGFDAHRKLEEHSWGAIGLAWSFRILIPDQKVTARFQSMMMMMMMMMLAVMVVVVIVIPTIVMMNFSWWIWYVFCGVQRQLMVNCWFGARWFGFLGSVSWKGLLLKGTLRILNHQPKPTINQ